MLYCPHCDEFHLDSELTILVELDYVECFKSNREIKTYKYINSENVITWRKEHDFTEL